MNRIVLWGFSLAALVSGCGGGSDSSSLAGGSTASPSPGTVVPTAETNGSYLLTGADTTIAGIPVPPPPSDAANSTPAGIDVDRNGVRDDVDRLIATAFGSNGQAYTAMLTAAKRLQAIVAPASLDQASIQTLVDSGVSQSRCLAVTSFAGDYAAASHALQVVIGATLNTPDRIKRYQDRVSKTSAVIDIDLPGAC
ncbi:hypothetical protein SAMN04487926_1616 [Paraburkholderia steynii]|uniref:Lipoprotein n=1 Tax=Paraburkholderia steynii TaxID=1245441 RepID=A0A7Z7BLU5_9BURK|nr:hypothetical protein [Paraburkholderia steynii]SDJ54328.1 hypothetical protein SAMN04487926_1616 [Paraburkholderia steynii]